MTRVRHCLPIITVACLTSIGPVQADNTVGELREVQGTVLVNPDKNYFEGYSGMQLKPGAYVLALDGASAVVKLTDGRLTQLKSNSLFILRGLDNTYRRGAATVRKIGPYYTEAIGAGTTNDAPAVAAGATRDKGPPSDAANMAMALGGGAGGAITGSTMGTIDEVTSVRESGPYYTEAFSASTMSDGLAVVAGATRDKGLPIAAANMALLGGGVGAITGSSTMGTITMGTIEVTQQQQQVDDRPPPISAFR